MSDARTERFWTPAAVMAAAALAVAILGSLVGIIVAITFAKEPHPADIRRAVADYCEGEDGKRPCRSVVPGPPVDVPPGMVAAFFSKNCPKGWEPFLEGQGRFLVGAGNNGGRNKGADKKVLSDRSWTQKGNSGGTEEHELAPDELAPHSHSYSRAKRVKRGDGDKGAAEYPSASDTTGESGKGKPHNNMPPFVVATFCKKKADA